MHFKNTKLRYYTPSHSNSALLPPRWWTQVNCITKMLICITEMEAAAAVGWVSSGYQWVQYQVFKLHPSALQSLFCRGRIPNCIHACRYTRTLLHARWCMQFVILPLQQGSSAHSCMQFGILPLHYSDCSLRTAVRTAACAYMQFENLPLQPGSSQYACMQRGGRNFRPVDL
jgi:hypothetical protein